MNNIKIGQVVYEVSNRTGKINERKVLKVGRKWIYVDDGSRFDIDTLRVDAGGYTPTLTIYLSIQDYNDSLEASKISKLIRDKIGQYGDIRLPIDKLKQILQILTDNDR